MDQFNALEGRVIKGKSFEQSAEDFHIFTFFFCSYGLLDSDQYCRRFERSSHLH